MLNFCATRPKGNPTMPDGVTAPTLDAGPYRITPHERRGGIGWTLHAPGCVETFPAGDLGLADAIRRADTLAAIDRAIDLRGLRFED